MLICSEGGSNKFWEATVASNVVTTRWGRIGLKGQSKQETFDNDWEAARAVKGMISAKLRKGYVKVSDDDFALKQLQATIIGTFNKVGDLTWMTPMQDKPRWFMLANDKTVFSNPAVKPFLHTTIWVRTKDGSIGIEVLFDMDGFEIVKTTDRMAPTLFVGKDVVPCHQVVRSYKLDRAALPDGVDKKTFFEVAEKAKEVIAMVLENAAAKEGSK